MLKWFLKCINAVQLELEDALCLWSYKLFVWSNWFLVERKILYHARSWPYWLLVVWNTTRQQYKINDTGVNIWVRYLNVKNEICENKKRKQQQGLITITSDLKARSLLCLFPEIAAAVLGIFQKPHDRFFDLPDCAIGEIFLQGFWRKVINT